MVFGYQQGGSFSQHKQALGFDAATTEQMRLKQIAEQRKREQQLKAKQDSQSKNVKLRIVQDEISRRSMEVRRIEANIVKLTSESHVHVENHTIKITELKNKITEVKGKINELKNKINELERESKELERESEKEVGLKNYADKMTINQERELNAVKSRKKIEDDALSKLKEEERRLEAEIKDLDRLATQ